MADTPVRVTNKKFMEEDRLFKKACELAGTPLTKRQASKFRRGIGSAAIHKRAAQAALGTEESK